MDITVPADGTVDAKEKEKIQKYQDLVRELRKVWKVKVIVVLVVFGALGTIPHTLESTYKLLGQR